MRERLEGHLRVKSEMVAKLKKSMERNLQKLKAIQSNVQQLEEQYVNQTQTTTTTTMVLQANIIILYIH